MEHIIQYVIAKLEEKKEETAYRVYLTDALKIIGENTAKFNGGSVMSKRYYDLAFNEKQEPEKTAEQILDEVIKNAGLEVI